MVKIGLFGRRPQRVVGLEVVPSDIEKDNIRPVVLQFAFGEECDLAADPAGDAGVDHLRLVPGIAGALRQQPAQVGRIIAGIDVVPHGRGLPHGDEAQGARPTFHAHRLPLREALDGGLQVLEVEAGLQPVAVDRMGFLEEVDRVVAERLLAGGGNSFHRLAFQVGQTICATSSVPPKSASRSNVQKVARFTLGIDTSRADDRV